MSSFNIGDNIIDSRELIERLEELQGERDALKEALEAATDTADNTMDADEAVEAQEAMTNASDALADWDDENRGEYAALESACTEGEASPDWTYGTTLVHDSYFTDYVMDMLADIGDLPREIPWYIVIDRDATADNVRSDYFSIDLGGETYWVRA